MVKVVEGGNDVSTPGWGIWCEVNLLLHTQNGLRMHELLLDIESCADNWGITGIRIQVKT